MAWIDAVILLLFILYSVSSGFRASKKASQGLEEYFLAGRTLPGWKAGISMAATQYSADTPLLVAGLVAAAGFFSLWRLWIYAISFLFAAFVLAAAWRRAGILTDAEFTELRYSGRAAFWLRMLKAVYSGTIINCTVLAMVLTAAARIAEPFLIWHEWLPAGFIDPIAAVLESRNFILTALPSSNPMVWTYSASNFISIGLIVSFTWLYSTTGGLRSVVATDVVQFAVMMTATALYAGWILARTGGFSGIVENLSELYSPEKVRILLSFGPPQWDAAAYLFMGVLSVQWFAQISSDGSGYIAQRAMACSNEHEARVAGVVFSVAQILLRSLLWMPIVLGLLILYPAAHLPLGTAATEAFRIEREASFALGIKDILPAGIRGLMLTGMFAALASTVDTHLNWGASYWSNDLYKRGLMETFLKRTPSSKELVWAARFSNFFILVVSLFIAVNLSSVQSAWHISLLVGSGLGTVLILRWVWHRINVYSEIAACGSSLVLSPILLFAFPQMEEGARLLWMTGLSSSAVILVTLLTPPEPDETLQRFYRRVRPPGFWKPAARIAGESGSHAAARFWKGAGASLLAALSIFLLLTGTVKFFFPLPGQPGAAGAAVLLLGGAALIPVWMRLGFHR